MAQYTADFAGDTPGSPPPGFTVRWNVSGSPVWSVTADADASADRIVQLSGASTVKRLLSFDAVDGDANRDEVEVLTRVRISTMNNNFKPVIVVRGSGASGFENGYAVSITLNNIGFYRYVNGGGFNNIGHFNNLFISPAATWLYIRFRVEGTTLKARSWTDQQPEPGWWPAQVTNTQVSGVGWVGFNTFENVTTYAWDYLIVATDGDTADFSDLPATDEIHATTASYCVIGNIPSESIEATTGRYAAVVEEGEPMIATKAAYCVVCLGRIEVPYVYAWPATLDGHDFYFLQLQNLTLVQDTYSEQWYNWGSGASELWRAQYGINWLGNISRITDDLGGTRISNILVGDNTTGALYFLDPEGDEDDDADGTTVPFQRLIYGQAVAYGTDFTPCYGVSLRGSIGEFVDAANMNVTLSYSDNQGHSFYTLPDGAITLTNGNWTEEVSWRSLGSFRNPGRIFRFEDFGALIRVDALQWDDGETDVSFES